MKIKLTNEIESVCGRFILPVNCELDVTDTDEQRGVYEASYNEGFFVIPFQCAEAIVEHVGGEKCERVTYDNEKDRIKSAVPLDYVDPQKEWKIETRPVEQKPEQETSTGGSSKYYDLIINGQAVKVEDIVKDVFGNDFDYGNAFKALVRSFALRSGGGKAGSTVDYECEKIKYYAGRIQKQ